MFFNFVFLLFAVSFVTCNKKKESKESNLAIWQDLMGLIDGNPDPFQTTNAITLVRKLEQRELNKKNRF